jgi:hypothetical protein
MYIMFVIKKKRLLETTLFIHNTHKSDNKNVSEITYGQDILSESHDQSGM